MNLFRNMPQHGLKYVMIPSFHFFSTYAEQFSHMDTS